MRHRAKFRTDCSNRCDVWPFFDFSKVGNFTRQSISEAQSASPCQILCWSVKPFRRYGPFRFFKIAAFRHLGFLKVRNATCRYGSEAQCVSSCQISCRSVKPLRRYSCFSTFPRWRPSAILDLHYSFGPPAKSVWWSLWLCKIWLESVQ